MTSNGQGMAMHQSRSLVLYLFKSAYHTIPTFLGGIAL